MSTYITIDQLQIQNANCISGLTYGFPAVTHFLGYVHALSRKLEQSHQLTLGGTAIVCHQHHVHAYQIKDFGEYIFAQTRNPLTKTGNTAPIIEEGKIHLTISLVIKCGGLIVGGDEGVKSLQKYLEKLCLTQKLAGGVINQIKKIIIESANTNHEKKQLTRKIRRRLLPGFLLLDRSRYLMQHLSALQETDPKAEMLDAWMDFSSLKFQAETHLQEDNKLDNKTKVNWNYMTKPKPGYLVPISMGYRAISNVYAAGEVSNSRDPEIPFCFVEAAYSLGEWQSPHRLQDIESALWHYHYKEGWYLCANKTSHDEDTTEYEEDNFDDA